MLRLWYKIFLFLFFHEHVDQTGRYIIHNVIVCPAKRLNWPKTKRHMPRSSIRQTYFIMIYNILYLYVCYIYILCQCTYIMYNIRVYSPHVYYIYMYMYTYKKGIKIYDHKSGEPNRVEEFFFLSF